MSIVAKSKYIDGSVLWAHGWLHSAWTGHTMGWGDLRMCGVFVTQPLALGWAVVLAQTAERSSFWDRVSAPAAPEPAPAILAGSTRLWAKTHPRVWLGRIA